MQTGVVLTPGEAEILRRLARRDDSIRGLGIGNTYGAISMPPPDADDRRVAPDNRPFRLKIVGNRTRGGAYRAYLWYQPITTSISFDANVVTAASDFGLQGPEVVAINMAEVGQSTVTHDLTAGTPQILFGWGFPAPLISSTDGLPVYEIWMVDWKLCS